MSSTKIIVDVTTGQSVEMDLTPEEQASYDDFRQYYEDGFSIRLSSQLSQHAWEIEVGGITINGIRIDTSDRSKLLINGMYNLASQGNPSHTRKFKSKDGEIEITNEQAMAVAVAVGEHVQKRINAEGIVLAEIESGTITTLDDAKAAFDNIMSGTA